MERREVGPRDHPHQPWEGDAAAASHQVLRRRGTRAPVVLGLGKVGRGKWCAIPPSLSGKRSLFGSTCSFFVCS